MVYNVFFIRIYEAIRSYDGSYKFVAITIKRLTDTNAQVQFTTIDAIISIRSHKILFFKHRIGDLQSIFYAFMDDLSAYFSLVHFISNDDGKTTWFYKRER